MKTVLSYSVVAEEFERLLDVDKRYNNLKSVLNSNCPDFITVTMIAKVNNVTRQDVINRPWMMPNYGRTEKIEEGRKKRFWNFEEYLDWVEIPEYVRIQNYRDFTA